MFEELEPAQRSAVVRFVTSTGRAPLGGFQHLHPPFTIHRVDTRAPNPLAGIGVGRDLELLPSARWGARGGPCRWRPGLGGGVGRAAPPHWGVTPDCDQGPAPAGLSTSTFSPPPHPRAPARSTCFCMLKLPPYATKKALRDKLLYSVTSGAGFELS